MKLAYTVEGADSLPALVLSSSLGTTRELWDAQLPALAPHFRVVRYDHPGHGESPIPGSPVTIEDLAADCPARPRVKRGMEAGAAVRILTRSLPSR